MKKEQIEELAIRLFDAFWKNEAYTWEETVDIEKEQWRSVANEVLEMSCGTTQMQFTDEEVEQCKLNQREYEKREFWKQLVLESIASNNQETSFSDIDLTVKEFENRFHK